jgi:16S rRNA (guanine(966)-N(2))-methyltransferase RsmD
MPKRRAPPERFGTPVDSHPNRPRPGGAESELRIVGGTLRGRRLTYDGDPRTRPMKERVREAVFNLLGPDVVGKHAIDLFAGTGALGLEAISRGAVRATFFERHFPTAESVRLNAERLGVSDRCQVIAANTMLHFRRNDPIAQGPAAEPWLVFCSPPYSVYVEHWPELQATLETIIRLAPAGSQIVVEAEEGFDFDQLDQPERWFRRDYPPAAIAILET